MNIQNLETKLFLATKKLAAATENDSDDVEEDGDDLDGFEFEDFEDEINLMEPLVRQNSESERDDLDSLAGAGGEQYIKIDQKQEIKDQKIAGQNDESIQISEV